jgi:hypothetical protein
MKKIPPLVVVLVLGCGMMIPSLWSYGLWDPLEVRHADVAQELATSGNFLDVTQGGRYGQRPVLSIWLVAAGFKLFGVSEFAGRFPLALCAILTLLAAFRVVRRLVNDRAALVGVFVLATTPTFLFQGRQLIGEVEFYAALVAGAGGLAAYLWPASGKRCPFDLVLAVVGLVAGFLAKGLLLGVAFPLGALAIAIGVSWNTPHRPDAAGIWPALDGDDLGRGETVGQALKRAYGRMVIALGAAGVVIVGLLITLKGTTYMLLGGTWHKVDIPATFETTFKKLGFGFFPWFALVPVALCLFVLAQRRDPARRNRAAFAQALIVIFSVAGYVVASLWAGYLGQIRFPALPWLAMGVGLLIYQAWSQEEPVHRLWGVVAAGLILVLHQDFFMVPQSLAFAHVLGGAKYPIELNIKMAVRVFGILLSLGFFLSLGGLPQLIKLDWDPNSGRGIKRWIRLAAHYVIAVPFTWCHTGITTMLGWIGGPRNGRWYWIGTGGIALVFAGWCAFYLTPNLSLHMSNKALFQVFHGCREGGEKLAQYQVSGRGAAYYNKGQVEAISNQAQLFKLLRSKVRWFILIPAGHLGPVDQAARQQKVTYYVLDDRSSQYLLLSNHLEGKCSKDRNPLLRFRLKEAPKPRRVFPVNFENRVKLLGYDVADTVTRGGKFPITLYFQVLGRMPSGYKIFLHFDQPAHRFHGDHIPLDGKLATQYWLPGDYIVDTHKVEIPLITTPGGTYTIYMGFWLGSQRLKVVEGPNDGVNRVKLGTIRVR